VDGVDLDLAAGQCVAILGANGAGKTTLLRMFATLIRPLAGTLEICGHDVTQEAAKARAKIGYLGHDPQVYLDLTCSQNMEFFGDLHGAPRQSGAELLERVGLLLRSNDRVRDLSRGMVQRLGIARMLLSEPELLLLDEPHAGLDAQGQALLDAIISERRGRGVVLITHDADRAATLADQVVRLEAGRLA
jgi:heme exporter protein A